MFLKYVAGLHAHAKAALDVLRASQCQTTDTLLETLEAIARMQGEEPNDARFGERVRTYLEAAGGAETVQALCQSIVTYKDNHYLPLLSPYYKVVRPTVFKLLRTLSIHAASPTDAVEQALHFVLDHARVRGATLPATISLAFASGAWQRFVMVPE
jgi:hypothetical protein